MKKVICLFLAFLLVGNVCFATNMYLYSKDKAYLCTDLESEQFSKILNADDNILGVKEYNNSLFWCTENGFFKSNTDGTNTVEIFANLPKYDDGRNRYKYTEIFIIENDILYVALGGFEDNILGKYNITDNVWDLSIHTGEISHISGTVDNSVCFVTYGDMDKSEYILNVYSRETGELTKADIPQTKYSKYYAFVHKNKIYTCDFENLTVYNKDLTPEQTIKIEYSQETSVNIDDYIQYIQLYPHVINDEVYCNGVKINLENGTAIPVAQSGEIGVVHHSLYTHKGYMNGENIVLSNNNSTQVVMVDINTKTVKSYKVWLYDKEIVNTLGWKLLKSKFSHIDEKEIMQRLIFFDRDYHETIMALE